MADHVSHGEQRAEEEMGVVFRCPSCACPLRDVREVTAHVSAEHRADVLDKRDWYWSAVCEMVFHLLAPPSEAHQFNIAHRELLVVCPLCVFVGKRFLKHFQRKHKRLSLRQLQMLEALF